VLAFVERGNDAIVGTAFGRSHLEMNCQFCGACVDVCPTGALADKRGKWEGVPTATVPSLCPYCSVGCAVNIQVKNDSKVIRAVGRDQGPANDGQHGRLVEASWDEALSAVAEKLGPYRSAPPWEGDDPFALIASAAASNEESYALQKFARGVMKSNNLALASGFPDHDNAGELAYTLKTIDATTIRDIRSADCIMCIGTNPFDSHPILRSSTPSTRVGPIQAKAHP
jgi:predicted molibdopterin-dependent oxidoreductase YjgC